MALTGDHTFVGFGFGAIQAGLFLYEAFESGHFRRLVVAEVVPSVVEQTRDGNGTYSVNIAHADRIETVQVGPLEILDPNQPELKLKRWLIERRDAGRCRLGPDEMYCLPCRAAHRPDPDLVEVTPHRGSTCLAIGLCPACARLTQRIVRADDLPPSWRADRPAAA